MKSYQGRSIGTPMASVDLDAHSGVPLPQLFWGVLVITLGVTLVALDTAIANVALPTIAYDLHTSPSNSIWIVNGYQLAIAVLLLPFSSLGDRIGYRKIYLSGLALFTVASLICAASHSLLALTVGRAIQGFGAAAILSVNGALVRFLYPTRLLGRGVSINASVIAIASVAGPSVAASVLSIASWPWLFAVNVPIGVGACILGWCTLPHSKIHSRPYDTISAILNVLTIGSLTFAIDALGHGSDWLRVLPLGALAIASGYIFVRRQLRQTAPLLPVDLMRNPVFSLSVATSICSFVAQMLAFISLPFIFQESFGFSSARVGLLLTAWPLAVLCIAPFAGVLSDRLPAGILGGVGLALLTVGLVLLALLSAEASSASIVLRLAICGLGFGLFQTPNNKAILSAAPHHRTGGASGMIGTARTLGQTVGAALTSFIFAVSAHHGSVTALLTAAGFACSAAVVSLSRLAAAPSPIKAE